MAPLKTAASDRYATYDGPKYLPKNITGATPQCIRILVHVNTTTARDDLHHVYLHGATALRDDLPS